MATTYTVDGGSIQKDGIDQASSGDTVEVKPAGTYNESVQIKTKNITLRGVTDANGNSPVIKGAGVNTGSQPHAAIHVDDGSGPVRNVTIEGFTVRNPDGKFGIFAGTGTTNNSSDGIGGLLIQDNVIENVSTNSSGGSLTGGPAGIGIRGDYGTSGNPGIEIKNNEVTNVDTTGYTNAVGITLKSFTGDAGFGKDSSGKDVSDSSSPPATDTDIVNNDISKINGGGGSRAKGISVSGEFENVLVEKNIVRDVSATGGGIGSGNALAITFTENGGSYSKNKYDIDDDSSGERIGPRDFEIKENDIKQLSGNSTAAVFIGGYEDLGDHAVTGNNIDSGAVSRELYNQGGFQHPDADTLNATNNWWGDNSGPSGGETDEKTGTNADGNGNGVAGKVNFDPWSVRENAPDQPSIFSDKRDKDDDGLTEDLTGNNKETAADDRELVKLSEEGRLDSITDEQQNKLDYDGDGEFTFDDIVTKVFERKGLL